MGWFGRRTQRAKNDGAASISAADSAHLRRWAETRAGIDGYLEPATMLNQTSLLLVDLLGEYTRRPVGGEREAQRICAELGIELFDAATTGYPRRMRERDEAMRLQAKRERREQMRAQMDRDRTAEAPPNKAKNATDVAAAEVENPKMNGQKEE